MESRDILNYLGQVVGQLELPSGTSEEVWAQNLAPYAVAPNDVPVVVNALQIRLALINAGVDLTSIDTAVASVPEPTQSIMRARWEFATNVYRNGEFVLLVAQLMGWSSSYVDELFKSAASL